MEVSTAVRRIKRDFGDEYDVVVNTQDVYDWIHDAELDIIRSTSDNDLTLLVPANKFPIQVPDRVNIKRLSVNGRALTYLTYAEIDLNALSTTTRGSSSYWYFQGGSLDLWPAASPTDEYLVEVAYAKTPTHMSVVAPYLFWGVNPSTLQYGKIDSDDDWKLKPDINVALTLAFNTYTNKFNILTCGKPTSAALLHFNIDVQPVGGIPQLLFQVSNGTTIETHTLTFKTEPKLDEIFRMKVTFDSTTNTASLYKINPTTDVEILQSISVLTPASFPKNTTATADIFLGNFDDTGPPTAPGYSTPLMKMYDLYLRETASLTSRPTFIFQGEDDLSDLVAVMANFTSSSGHAVKTFGNIVIPGQNNFTVPEVFHEDVIKYCLAKAHDKNQNFRASEAVMEQYDRRVSTRRNEAQTIDGPIYKIADPFDYDVEGVVY